MKAIEQSEKGTPKTGSLISNPLPAFASSKIANSHWERLAVVYVRQSTARQVIEHSESTGLQYQLSERAEQYGWRKDRILVIDDDLG